MTLGDLKEGDVFRFVGNPGGGLRALCSCPRTVLEGLEVASRRAYRNVTNCHLHDDTSRHSEHRWTDRKVKLSFGSVLEKRLEQ